MSGSDRVVARMPTLHLHALLPGLRAHVQPLEGGCQAVKRALQPALAGRPQTEGGWHARLASVLAEAPSPSSDRAQASLAAAPAVVCLPETGDLLSDRGLLRTIGEGPGSARSASLTACAWPPLI